MQNATNMQGDKTGDVKSHVINCTHPMTSKEAFSVRVGNCTNQELHVMSCTGSFTTIPPEAPRDRLHVGTNQDTPAWRSAVTELNCEMAGYVILISTVFIGAHRNIPNVRASTPEDTDMVRRWVIVDARKLVNNPTGYYVSEFGVTIGFDAATLADKHMLMYTDNHANGVVRSSIKVVVYADPRDYNSLYYNYDGLPLEVKPSRQDMRSSFVEIYAEDETGVKVIASGQIHDAISKGLPIEGTDQLFFLYRNRTDALDGFRSCADRMAKGTIDKLKSDIATRDKEIERLNKANEKFENSVSKMKGELTKTSSDLETHKAKQNWFTKITGYIDSVTKLILAVLAGYSVWRAVKDAKSDQPTKLAYF